jgi:Rieske Fe-S protein
MTKDAKPDPRRADPDRRTTLRLTACALGGGVAAAVGVPILRVLGDAAGKTTVTSPRAPIDLGALERLPVDGEPVRFSVIAPEVRDGWNAAQNVVLGSAWLVRTGPSQCTALSSVCPHLACAVGWDAGKKHYVCPCHESLFPRDGERVSGPSERGLDPLPVSIVDGRIQLTWTRYRIGGRTREPA